MGKLLDVIKLFWVPDSSETGEIPQDQLDEKMKKEMDKTRKSIEKLEKQMNFEHIKVPTKNPKIDKATIDTDQKSRNVRELDVKKQNAKGKDNELTL